MPCFKIFSEFQAFTAFMLFVWCQKDQSKCFLRDHDVWWAWNMGC